MSGESLGGTRDRIRTNFQQIFDTNSINHEAFNTANKGKHKFLQMPEIVTQTPSTIPSTAADEGALYTNPGTNPTETNLYFRAESDGQEYQLTKTVSAQVAKFANNNEYDAGPPSLKGGWTFLPGGLIMQFGLYDTAASSSTLGS